MMNRFYEKMFAGFIALIIIVGWIYFMFHLPK